MRGAVDAVTDAAPAQICQFSRAIDAAEKNGMLKRRGAPQDAGMQR